MNTPPRAGTLYWVCQAAGWGGFLAYVLGAYLIAARPVRTWDIVSIVVFNGVFCPAISHALRRWLYARQWLELPLRRLVPRLAGVVAVLSATLAAGVALGVVVADGDKRLPLSAVAAVFVGFSWAFTGWLVIYYVVHARRRRDALEAVVREAQLQSLRAQLNPHFLFNCLNSIRNLIMEDPERAVAMVTGLSELLRYSLASDRMHTVALSEEMRVVDEYLELEHVRLDERLRVERAIDPATLDVQVPPMLIQTLVENAIKHGISNLTLGGVVRIDTRVSGERVEIRITNTGRLTSTATESGLGFRNALARLRLLFGDVASLTLGETDGETQARLVVPLAHEAGRLS